MEAAGLNRFYVELLGLGRLHHLINNGIDGEEKSGEMIARAEDEFLGSGINLHALCGATV